MVRIEAGIDPAVAAVGEVVEFADKIEGDARGPQPVLQTLPPAAAVRMRHPDGLAILEREIRPPRDAVAQRENAERRTAGNRRRLGRRQALGQRDRRSTDAPHDAPRSFAH
jgi:hypothetical protein